MFDSVIEHSPIMVFVKRASDLRLELLNRAAEEIMGYSRHDLLGKGNYDLWPEQQAAAFEAADRQVLAMPGILEIEEEPITRPGGELRYLHTWKVALRGEEGVPTHMLGISVDITERKKLEEELIELLSFNQTVVDKSDTGIMVHRESGECVLCNEAAALIVGASYQELSQHNFRQSRSWRESGQLAAADAALLSGVTQRFLGQMTTIYGKDIWCNAAISRILKNGEPHLLLVFTDVSRHRQAEEGMRQAKELAEAALARALEAERGIIEVGEQTLQRIGQELHDDLGQHLTGVAFLAESLCRDLQQHLLPQEIAAATRVTQLVNEAVSHVRQLAHGLYPIELKEAGLKEMLRNLASNVQSTCNIECQFKNAGRWQLKDSAITIHLYRIAQEAVSNAIRHGGATQIGIALSQTPKAKMLEITDNGCGMSESASAGMGIHSMQYRASMMGGTLLITPVDPGDAKRGTRVLISIPI